MPVTAVVGAQWGDEGKGKITDLLAQHSDLVVRFGGGGNAGHTVVNQHGSFTLHLIPCGIFHSGAVNLIGSGAVVDFATLSEEADHIMAAGVDLEGLRISSRAQVVMPYHVLQDGLEDDARGARSLGTTRRGVGPAYVDKAARVGIQAGDILLPDVVQAKLAHLLPARNRLLQDLYGARPLDLSKLMTEVQGWRQRWGRAIADQVEVVHDALESGQRVLLEGQLGVMRDLDWGTYPYVTSSTTIAGGGAVGGGIPARYIDDVVGVVKAYTSAVGTGPVPAEMHGEEADALRERGAEYGATTGRPRRVGWFDAVAVRYAGRVNGFTRLAVTKLDVLDGMSDLRLCVAYEHAGTRYSTVPITPILSSVNPVWEDMKGWEASTSEARRWEDLPTNARAYLSRIEELTGTPIGIVSVGPGREQTFFR